MHVSLNTQEFGIGEVRCIFLAQTFSEVERLSKIYIDDFTSRLGINPHKYEAEVRLHRVREVEEYDLTDSWRDVTRSDREKLEWAFIVDFTLKNHGIGYA